MDVSQQEMQKRIDKLHERALRVVYKDENLTFEQLLEKDEGFTIHERNLQKVALLMYKVKHGLCPSPVQAIFTPLENNVNLRGDRNGDWVYPEDTSLQWV